MAPSDSIRPLSPRQQLLFQKLLVYKVVSESQLKSLWSSTANKYNSNINDANNNSCDQQILKVINQSIKPAFGLEIRSVVLSLQGRENTTYYAIINLQPDLQAQTYACPQLSKQNPHLLALFHLIIQRLIDSSSNNDGLKSRKLGLGSTLSRMEMINMRMELMEEKAANETKVPLGHAESLVSWLEEQRWMVPVSHNGDEDHDDDKDEDDDEEEKDTAVTRKRKKSSLGGNSTRYQLGPRAYMEFPEFLVKAGMNRDGLPQCILY